MSLQDELFALEEQFWTRGAAFFRGNLTPAAMMVFPDPVGVLLKDEVVDSVSGQPRWRNVALEEHRLVELDPSAAVITYKVHAQREGDARPYAARASSAYVLDGEEWRLAFHQQTPLPD